MEWSVYLLDAIHQLLLESGTDPEVIRSAFEAFKRGDEFAHEWFCHDRGPDPGEKLSHVHFIPTDPVEEEKWLNMHKDRHKRKRRTSGRYVLYASDPRHGYLIIDILDDPGAHDLWKQRHTALPGYELAATDFCTFGPKQNLHR